ncbi:MAG: response regulator [Thermoanaerobaculia bacterium]
MTDRSVHLLIVEDEPSWSIRLSTALTAFEGVRTTVCENAAEAGERLAEEPFDLVMLDLTLPDDWGVDALIRVTAQAPHIPVVILSTSADEAAAIKSVEAGASAYVLKERVSPIDLFETVIHAIQRGRIDRAISEEQWLDPLTHLLNRLGFDRLAARHLRLAALGAKEVLSFRATADLQGFGKGHRPDVRDDILMTAADVLRSTFRHADLVARIGPAEFIALGIVQPADGIEEILERRLDEQLRAHDATPSFSGPIRLRHEMRRSAPDESIISDLLGAWESAR